ncbi:hypothetical protein DSO57_1016756 [Entomophthora muscae]|uniref:Uncharacterized protein n=2 Tax=Entomophthora muscae TaxID=34485 RepID=A0ACC2SHQ0_9FUNG|nr:hypothetical protein DSO57_1039453 [Entomophthora muscae]KAJ9061820.1 hypothetical protein DSO57_1016756 [Entomophthora muscae]
MPFEVYNHIGDDHFVHIGSKICLRHLATKRYIRSTARCYNGGSSQQMVIAASEQPEHEDWWQVCTAHGQQTPHGSKVPYGSAVRIYHMATGKWLHSHTVKSPASGQQEVSAYGDDNASDSNDNWIVEKCDNGSGEWHANDQFLLRHQGTGAFLHSHDVSFENANEVTTYAGDRADQNNVFGIRFG